MTLVRTFHLRHLVPSKPSPYDRWEEEEHGVDFYDVFRDGDPVGRVHVKRAEPGVSAPVVVDGDVVFYGDTVHDLRNEWMRGNTVRGPQMMFVDDEFVVRVSPRGWYTDDAADDDLGDIFWVTLYHRTRSNLRSLFALPLTREAGRFFENMKSCAWKDLRSSGPDDLLARYVSRRRLTRVLMSARFTEDSEGQRSVAFSETELKSRTFLSEHEGFDPRERIFVGREGDVVFEIFDGELIATSPDGRTRRRPFVLRDGETAKTTEDGLVAVDDGKSIKYYDVDVGVAERIGSLDVPEVVKRGVFRRVAFDENYSYDFS